MCIFDHVFRKKNSYQYLQYEIYIILSIMENIFIFYFFIIDIDILFYSVFKSQSTETWLCLSRCYIPEVLHGDLRKIFFLVFFLSYMLCHSINTCLSLSRPRPRPSHTILLS